MSEVTEETNINNTSTDEVSENGPKIDGVDFAAGRKGAAGQESKSQAQPPQSEEGSQAENDKEQETPDTPPKTELELALEEVQKLKDAWQRERAEFMNFRKRSQLEKGRIRIHSVADFVGGLMPVLDNLDNVLKAKTENKEVQNFVIGVEMIKNEFVSVLEKSNIKIFQPVNEPFDPEFMEAIASEEREELTRDTVLEVFQEGFFMEFEDGQKQVIRPARVKVGKASQTNKTDGEETPRVEA